MQHFKLIIVVLVSVVGLSECKPVYPRWFDYDYFPEAKPIHDSETGRVVRTVNPLRPYEPWILDCILFSSDKVEVGKRHERCRDVDESNEKEYARFLIHVAEWEEAYPERAARWNSRFPESKEKEKKKYEQLKIYADMHKKNVSPQPQTTEGFTTISTQRTECPNAPCNSTPEDSASDSDAQDEEIQEEDDKSENPEPAGEEQSVISRYF